MAKKASLQKLEELHGLITDYYKEMVSLGLEGEELSSGTLNAINAFLKANDIKVDVIESEDMNDLTVKFRSMIETREAM